jgi:hypothetical protein
MVGPPHFWPRDGWSHPYDRSEGGSTTPMAKGVVQPPSKGQKRDFGVWAFSEFQINWVRV